MNSLESSSKRGFTWNLIDVGADDGTNDGTLSRTRSVVSIDTGPRIWCLAYSIITHNKIDDPKTHEVIHRCLLIMLV